VLLHYEKSHSDTYRDGFFCGVKFIHAAVNKHEAHAYSKPIIRSADFFRTAVTGHRVAGVLSVSLIPVCVLFNRYTHKALIAK